MIKRLSDNLVTVASAAGLILLAVVVVGALADEIGLAVVGLALLQLLLLGVALLIWRNQQVTVPDGRATALGEINRAIANVGLRCVDEARATERELGARIDSLREALAAEKQLAPQRRATLSSSVAPLVSNSFLAVAAIDVRS